MKSIKIAFLLAFAYTSAVAQGQDADQAPLIDINILPEYAVIEVNFIGRISIISIDNRNSPYEAALEELEDLLADKEKLRIQNQTDLINSLSDIGFDYVDAFIVGGGDITSVVFRKKIGYRQADN